MQGQRQDHPRPDRREADHEPDGARSNVGAGQRPDTRAWRNGDCRRLCRAPDDAPREADAEPWFGMGGSIAIACTASWMTRSAMVMPAMTPARSPKERTRSEPPRVTTAAAPKIPRPMSSKGANIKIERSDIHIQGRHSSIALVMRGQPRQPRSSTAPARTGVCLLPAGHRSSCGPLQLSAHRLAAPGSHSCRTTAGRRRNSARTPSPSTVITANTGVIASDATDDAGSAAWPNH